MDNESIIQYIISHLPKLNDSDLKKIWIISFGLHIFDVAIAAGKELDCRRNKKYMQLLINVPH